MELLIAWPEVKDCQHSSNMRMALSNCYTAFIC